LLSLCGKTDWGIAVSREEKAHYVASITEELTKIVEPEDMPALAHLLRMTHLEARSIADAPPLPLPVPTPPEPKGKRAKRARPKSQSPAQSN
jgi:hypothetical protein